MTDIIDMLMADHAHVRSLFEDVLEPDGKTIRERTLSEICLYLQAHLDFEESELYPLLMEDAIHRIRALEAYEEHRQIATLMDMVNDMDGKDEATTAQVMVLAEDIRNHFSREEQVLYQLIRAAAPHERLASLTEVFAGYKRGIAAPGR